MTVHHYDSTSPIVVYHLWWQATYDSTSLMMVHYTFEWYITYDSASSMRVHHLWQYITYNGTLPVTVHQLWQYITYDGTSPMMVHHLWHRNTSWWTALPDPPECESRNFVMMHWCGRRSTALWMFLLQTLIIITMKICKAPQSAEQAYRHNAHWGGKCYKNCSFFFNNKVEKEKISTLTLHWDLKAMQLPCCCGLSMFQCCWHWCWLFHCGQRNSPQLQFDRG